MHVKNLSKLGLLSAALATLGACSTVSLDTERVDYRSTNKAPPLDIPPDLTQLTGDSRFAVPGSPVSASTYQTGAPNQKGPQVAVDSLGDAKVERAGNQRWLVVKRSPEQLWQPLLDFWSANGLTVVVNQPELGIMETDWAENRAKIPQDFIHNTISKVFDNLFTSDQKDKYRARLERRSDGGTDIYITHKGLIEVYTSGSKDQTGWQASPPDPELEAEFLQRLMVRLGSSPVVAKAALAGASAPTAVPSKVQTFDGLPGVEIADGFDRAWRRVGLALDRSSFTIEDRDRSQGVYFVRYVEAGADKKEGNFFTRLFGGSDGASALQKYRVTLKTQADKTTVTVTGAANSTEAAANAKKIAQIIADDLQ